jgi:hypothetical protein
LSKTTPTQQHIDQIFRFGTEMEIEELLELRIIPNSKQLNSMIFSDAISLINKSFYGTPLSLKLENDFSKSNMGEQVWGKNVSTDFKKSVEHDSYLQSILNKRVEPVLGETASHDYVDHYKDDHNITDYDCLNVFRSLSQRDQYIFERLPIYKWTKTSIILLYDITVTKPLLKIFLQKNKWINIIRLLHFSTKYDYVIDIFDNEIIDCCHDYNARRWIRENIIKHNTEPQYKLSFADPMFSYFVFDHMVDEFENEMMSWFEKQPILFDHTSCLKYIQDKYYEKIKKYSESISKKV